MISALSNVNTQKNMRDSKERWKDVVGFESYYQVSSHGNVMSKRTQKVLAHAVRDGYHRVRVSVNGKKSYLSVNRLVATAFLKNPENKPIVNHIDGVKTNNHIKNLEWATCTENNIHAYETKLKTCSKQRITPEKVRMMRRTKQEENISLRKLAVMYSVSLSTAHDVITMKVHKNVM